jgi:hypothetical protein
LAVLVASSTLLLGQEVRLTLKQKEEFLSTAKVINQKPLSEGITGALRLTLSDGKLTHDAQAQDIDEFKQVFTSALGTELNFRDSYKYNIAAYRLARILDLNMIPPSVERGIGGAAASVTWWLDNVLMTEKARYFQKKEPPDVDRWNKQMYIVRVFDQLIYNTDRNLGNLVIAKDWDIWMIDHTRAFRLHKKLKEERVLVKCDRKLLESLRSLHQASLAELKPFLTSPEISAVLARRDRIVEVFDAKVKQSGEAAVLYDLLPIER